MAARGKYEKAAMKRFLIIYMCICLSLTLTGCGGGLVFGDESRELDQLELVETLGIDADGELTTVTASTASAGAPVLLKTSAVTISRAVRQMQNYTAKKYIFYGHTSHILIGEAAALRDLYRCLDYLERDSEIRLDTGVYLVQGGTAENAMRAVNTDSETAGDLLESLDRDVQLLSESYVFSLGEIAQMLAKRNCALAAAVMLQHSENILSGENALTIQSAGYAVLQGGTLLGFLDTNLARGVNLLIDRCGSDVVEADDGSGSFFAARLTGSKVEYEPLFADGVLSGVNIRISVRCNLDELQTPLEIYDEDVIRAMEAGLAAVEQHRVEAVLRQMQSWNCDFCDLQTRVRQYSPRRFDRMPVSWETLFPELDFSVEVSAELERTYDAGMLTKEGAVWNVRTP